MILRTPTGKRVSHGRRHTYQAYGCRCSRCIKAQAEYVKKWRTKTKRMGRKR